MMSLCECGKDTWKCSEGVYSEWLTVEKFLFFKGNLKASVVDLHAEVQQSKV